MTGFCYQTPHYFTSGISTLYNQSLLVYIKIFQNTFIYILETNNQKHKILQGKKRKDFTYGLYRSSFLYTVCKSETKCKQNFRLK